MKNYYVCADTLYQEFFAIDEIGNYYEGWKLKATNFDYIIEDLAIYDEVNNLALNLIVEEYFENINLDIDTIYSDLSLTPY